MSESPPAGRPPRAAKPVAPKASKRTGTETKARPAKKASAPELTPEHFEQHLPPFDQAAVSRVVPRVEIKTIELVGGHFLREQDGPLAVDVVNSTPDSIGIGAEWTLSDDGSRLGCALTFATDFQGPAPYHILARFRLLYELSPGEAPSAADLEQFVYWNAVFHAYPYWREYVSSTLARAELPQFFVPVMRMPKSA